MVRSNVTSSPSTPPGPTRPLTSADVIALRRQPWPACWLRTCSSLSPDILPPNIFLPKLQDLVLIPFCHSPMFARPSRPCIWPRLGFTGYPALTRVRHQPSVVHRRSHRRRPDRLATNPRPRPRIGHRRTQTAALPSAAHRRQPMNGQRRRSLRIPSTWLWATQITAGPRRPRHTASTRHGGIRLAESRPSR
jgi:hypothetical protein